jgi:nicotinate-nucleotide adenylyltransferase
MEIQTPTLDSKRPRRIGILGGSFDPVHTGHLIMAEAARESLSLDLVLFAPVAEQPLKQGKPVSGAEDRVAMVQAAIAGNPAFALSRVDVDRPGPSYTARTVEILRHEWGNEGASLWFIIGADSLSTFPRWRDPARILSVARLAVVRRPGVSVDLPAIRAVLPEIDRVIDWVDAPLIDISATDLRRRVASGLSIRYRVPEAVREYIEQHGLYR